MIVVSCMVQTTKETLIQSQSQLLQEFLYMAASWLSLKSSLFVSVLFLAIYKNPRVKPDNDLFSVSLTCIIREIKVKFDNAFISFF